MTARSYKQEFEVKDHWEQAPDERPPTPAEKERSQRRTPRTTWSISKPFSATRRNRHLGQSSRAQ